MSNTPRCLSVSVSGCWCRCVYVGDFLETIVLLCAGSLDYCFTLCGIFRDYCFTAQNVAEVQGGMND